MKQCKSLIKAISHIFLERLPQYKAVRTEVTFTRKLFRSACLLLVDIHAEPTENKTSLSRQLRFDAELYLHNYKTTAQIYFSIYFTNNYVSIRYQKCIISHKRIV